MKLDKLFTLLFACAVLLLQITACKKNDVGPSILGTWNQDTNNGNFIFRSSYQFSADSIIVLERTVLDNNGKQLGYTYRMTGKYAFGGNTINMHGLSAVSYNAGYGIYTSLQNLTPTPIIADQNLIINLSADKLSFTVINSCYGINVSCPTAESLLYKKQ